MSYHLGPVTAEISLAKLIIALLMATFAVGELVPAFSKIAFPKKYLVIGGLLSGFFGGLSGHQGALRSAFMTKLSLTPQRFIGTGSAIGLMVDVARLSVYLWWLFVLDNRQSFTRSEFWLILTGLCAAILGVAVGRALVPKAISSRGVFLS